jgi:hypothetical protein
MKSVSPLPVKQFKFEKLALPRKKSSQPALNIEVFEIFLTALAANENAPGMISISTGVFPISSPSAWINAWGTESRLTLLARAVLTQGSL